MRLENQTTYPIQLIIGWTSINKDEVSLVLLAQA